MFGPSGTSEIVTAQEWLAASERPTRASDRIQESLLIFNPKC